MNPSEPSFPTNSMLSAVHSMHESLSEKASEKPQYGRYVHKLCDRDAQKSGFLHFFKQNIRACPKRPQFYWLPENCGGDKKPCHLVYVNDFWMGKYEKYEAGRCPAQIDCALSGLTGACFSPERAKDVSAGQRPAVKFSS